jgi:SAM-dependent methyltransferase
MMAPSGSWYALAYEALRVKPEPRWEFDVVLGRLKETTVYEIGCGPGMFLRMCRDRGIPAFGMDFSDYCIEVCLSQGLVATKGDLQTHRISLATQVAAPEVVVSFHVLEHLDQPDDFFRHSYEVSGAHATLWVSVPSCARVARVLDLEEPLDDPPHHMTKWTEAALRECGHRNGWVLDELLFEQFSWRSALYAVASHYHVYDWMQRRGWLRLSLWERLVRALLYPAALVQLLARRDRASMTGLAMLASFRKAL